MRNRTAFASQQARIALPGGLNSLTPAEPIYVILLQSTMYLDTVQDGEGRVAVFSEHDSDFQVAPPCLEQDFPITYVVRCDQPPLLDITQIHLMEISYTRWSFIVVVPQIRNSYPNSPCFEHWTRTLILNQLLEQASFSLRYSLLPLHECRSGNDRWRWKGD